MALSTSAILLRSFSTHSPSVCPAAPLPFSRAFLFSSPTYLSIIVSTSSSLSVLGARLRIAAMLYGLRGPASAASTAETGRWSPATDLSRVKTSTLSGVVGMRRGGQLQWNRTS